MLPAAVAIGGGEAAVALGGLGVGIASTIRNLDIDSIVSDNTTFFDRLSVAFPSLRIAKFLLDSADDFINVSSAVVETNFKETDSVVSNIVGNVVEKNVDIANDNIERLKSKPSEIISDSDYVYNGEPLVSVFVNNANLLDRRLSMIADILVKQSVSNNTSVISSLSALNSTVSSLNVSLMHIASAVSSVAGYFDVQNILTSEVYGILFELKSFVDKISQSLVNSKVVDTSVSSDISDVNIDVSAIVQKLQDISNSIDSLRNVSDISGVIGGLNSLKDVISQLDLSVVNNNSVDVDLSKIDELKSVISDVFGSTRSKDEAVLEHLSFKKDVYEVKDLDGNIIARISPRELTAIKDAVKARAVTDEINFELDEDDIDLVGGFDLDLPAFERFSDIVKAVKDSNGS